MDEIKTNFDEKLFDELEELVTGFLWPFGQFQI
jgi:hypothetical protein